jgi:outer membrane immunogenic protein
MTPAIGEQYEKRCCIYVTRTDGVSSTRTEQANKGDDMRHVLSGIACVIAVPALGADLPRKAPVMAPVAPVYSWSGFYIGGHLGGTWGEKNSEIVSAPGFFTPGTLVTAKPSGFIGGGQTGVNWQRGTWVLGAEFDWSSTNANDTVLVPTLIPGVSGRSTDDSNWFATATGRLGYAMNNILIYAKGGAAWMDVNYTIAAVTAAGGVVLVGPTSISDRRAGWTVGGGIEFGITPSWSAKIEYNYLDFGHKLYTFTAPGATLTSNAENPMQLIKGGINYRFAVMGP